MGTPQASALQTVPQFLNEQPAIGRKKFYEMLKTNQLPAYHLGRRILLNPAEVLETLKGSVKR